MADLDFTSVDVRDASPVNNQVKINMLAGVAIVAGQALTINSSGLAILADASAAGTAVAIGVALEDASANQAVPILVDGFLEGFDLSGVAYGALLSLSDTAGDIDNGAGSPTVAAPMGRVWSIGDNVATKIIFLNCSFNLNVVPA